MDLPNYKRAARGNLSYCDILTGGALDKVYRITI
jgi:hypothetical protein